MKYELVYMFMITVKYIRAFVWDILLMVKSNDKNKQYKYA